MPSSPIDLAILLVLLLLYSSVRFKSRRFIVYYFLPSFFWFVSCILLQSVRYNGGDLHSYIYYRFPHPMSVWALVHSLFKGTLSFSFLIFILIFELKLVLFQAQCHLISSPSTNLSISKFPNSFPSPFTSQKSQLIYYIFFLSPTFSLFINFSGKDNIIGALALLASCFLLYSNISISSASPVASFLCKFPKRYSVLIYTILVFLILSIRFYYIYYLFIPLVLYLQASTTRIPRKLALVFLFLSVSFTFALSYVLNNTNFSYYLSNIDSLKYIDGGDFTSADLSSLSLAPFPFPFSLLQAFRPLLIIDPFSHVLILSCDFLLVFILSFYFIFSSRRLRSLRILIITLSILLIPLFLLSLNPNVADNTRKLPTLFLALIPLLYISSLPLKRPSL
jgi:hypothetical protein